MSEQFRTNDLSEQFRTNDLIDFFVESVNAAQSVDRPFHHIEFKKFLPDELYLAMLAQMPDSSEYRPMSGSGSKRRSDGTYTRMKIDLFPEHTRRLSPEQQAVWGSIGQALRSKAVKSALIQRFANDLRSRFGVSPATLRFYPVPMLTRDVAEYDLAPHPDHHSKGITVQFYLPRDETIANLGTVFYDVVGGELVRAKQMKFLPNTGYAFTVDKHTWHSVDRVESQVDSRDSILITFYVDTGAQAVLNRIKRIGNFALAELRRFLRRISSSTVER